MTMDHDNYNGSRQTTLRKTKVGALNPDRLAEFIDRYRSFDDPDIPAFMYGSHYSTAVGVVLHYLVRLQPFADLHREMQVCVSSCVRVFVCSCAARKSGYGVRLL